MPAFLSFVNGDTTCEKCGSRVLLRNTPKTRERERENFLSKIALLWGRRALPITQHEHIWPEYVAWAKEFGVAATCVVLYKRYVMFEPNRREQFVEYLSKIGRHGDAAAERGARRLSRKRLPERLFEENPESLAFLLLLTTVVAARGVDKNRL